jgi:2-polyprenyl-3-methyl-5-hydroxy-6-metoxy-1,4-benzoquinol methylase
VSPEPSSDLTEQEAEVAKRYFGSFVDDYHQAFEGRGRQPLHALINRLFRRKTFQRRTDVVREWLAAHGVEGKHVLDLGCGSGEVSLVAARLGARVTGLDIVPGMIAVATEQAAAAGLADRTTFRVHNLVHDAIEPADVVMMIGVIEYYRDIDRLLPRVAGAVREMLVIVDTRGPWWRRTLRRVLARMKSFHLYYHPPDRVSRIVAGAGLRETRRVAGHSYTAMTFER